MHEMIVACHGISEWSEGKHAEGAEKGKIVGLCHERIKVACEGEVVDVNKVMWVWSVEVRVKNGTILLTIVREATCQ